MKLGEEMAVATFQVCVGILQVSELSATHYRAFNWKLIHQDLY